MSLKERLSDEMKSAMKNKEKLSLSTIRMVISAVKNKEIEKGGELDDSEVEELIVKAVKQRRDSAEQYRNGDRIELAEKEEAEIVILKAYLPQQMGEAQIRGLVRAAVEEAGATSIKEMGKVMGLLMPKVKGKADGSTVNKIVKEILGA
ncbi:Transamidase GatB domain protein [hydrothermal vent metagenome]|uniref:Transamidase GatB domain protein n=1 Tax=hydrothermal vent metagenome TaxID=652676 RepID=A0A3B1BLN6_9ZZZZ